MIRTLLPALLLALTLLSGCLAGDGADSDGRSDADERRLGTDPDRRDSGGSGNEDGDESGARAQMTPGAREFERTDSPVETEMDLLALGWRGVQTVTIRNDMAGFAPASILIDTLNGDVAVEPWDQDRYEVVVSLSATGQSEQQVEELIASMIVYHQDGAAGGRLDILTYLEFQDYNPPTQIPGVQIGTGHSRSADLLLRVPGGDGLDLNMDTTNGDIGIGAIRTAELVADTTNGDITVDGLETRGLFLDTTNGDITADMAPTGSGSWSLDSTNGDLELRVRTADHIGYLIEADTTNGRVTIDVDDTTVEQDDGDEASAVTNGFSSRDIRVVVGLDTTNGNIDVTG